VNGLASPLVWWAILLIIASFTIIWLYVAEIYSLTSLFPPLSRVVDILVSLHWAVGFFLGESNFDITAGAGLHCRFGLALVCQPLAQIEKTLIDR